MIQTREEAVRRALNLKTNAVGMCQAIVRAYFDAPSAGDADGDGDSDAADGWYKEPVTQRHVGDRNPPAGVPLYFSKSGGAGNGHRALNLEQVPGGKVRSSDFDSDTKRYSPGVVGTGTIKQVEAAMGVTYVGWSSTIDGYPIPSEAPQPGKKSRGAYVDRAIRNLQNALRESPGAHKKKINDAKKLLLEIPAE